MKKSYLYPLNPVTYYKTFYECLQDITEKYGERTAITTYTRKGTKKERNYLQFRADAERFAAALLAHGYQGAHIALVGENSYYWLVAYFGAAISGNVAVCVDIEQSEEVLGRMISEADCQLAVVSPANAPVVGAILKNIKSRDKEPIPLVVNQSDERVKDIVTGGHPYQTFGDFCKEKVVSSADLTAAEQRLRPEATVAIVFTSGTTSLAKAVMLSHEAILTNAADAIAMVDPKSTCFAVLPFYHAYGFTAAALTSLIANMNVCINGDLKTMIRDMTNFKPEFVVAVPMVVESIHRMIWSKIEQAGQKEKVRRLMKLGQFLGRPSLFLKGPMRKSFRGTPVERLTVMVCGGAYLAPRVAEDLECFGILVLQGYGITECSPLVSVNRNRSYSHSTVGYVVPHFEVRIKDEEIQVRGKSLMNGYYGHLELTEETMDNGWFKTGDLGSVDKRGHLYILGRQKNLIVMNNGKKISPEEYESVLREIPLVREVIAYGASSGSSVDDVKIAIMVYPDPDLSAGLTSYEILAQLQQEVDALNKKLPTYKQIQMINIRDSEFSKTAKKSIKRKIV